MIDHAFASPWQRALKSSQSRRRRTGTPLDILVAPEVLDQALSYGAASTVYDIFCVTDLITDIQEFDECDSGETCEVELTIDKGGHDYLREMCAPSRYMVLEDIPSLPLELPKIYQRHIRTQLSE